MDPLLADLTDAQARELLARELRGRAARNAPVADPAHSGFGVLLVELRQWIEGFAQRVVLHAETLARGARELPGAWPGVVDALDGERGFRPMLIDLAVVLAAAFMARAAVGQGFARTRSRLEQAPQEGPGRRITFACARAGLEAGGLAAFALVALTLATVLTFGDEPARNLVFAYASAALVVLAAAIPARTLLAPAAPPLRLLPLDDARARFLWRATMAFVATGTLAWLTAGLVILTGVPMPVHLFIVAVTGAAMAALGVAYVLRWGARFAAPRGAPWPALAAGYVVVVYLLWLQEILSRGANAVWSAIGSLLVVAAVPLAWRLTDRAVATLLPAATPDAQTAAPGPGTADETQQSLDAAAHERTQALERRAHYAAVIGAALRAALAVAGTIIVLEIWGLGLLGLALPPGALFRAGMVVLIALAMWLVFRAMVRPYLPTPGLSAGDEDGTIPRTRAETLLPLAYTSVAVLIGLFTFMIVLSTLGVNVAPLLAGAGVVGLAIGFGAQTLVRDIVAGIFFLIDDAFRVGEYVEFDKLRGEVERITLRSLKLRHHRGAIHTVPFGELRAVTNYSRDWVIYKMEFRLHADTDVERVRKLVKKLGQELMEDPEFGQDFLQPLKSQGIAAVDENAIILRCKFMSKPRKQFVLRRHCYQRLKQLFDEEGIEFAPRTVRVASTPTLAPLREAGEAGGAGAAVAAAEQGQV